MLTRICLSLALLVATPASCQVDVNIETDHNTAGQAVTAVQTKDDQIPTPYRTPMLIPPPVGVEAYPTVAGSETRSDYLRNYLRAGLTINSTYSDNVIATVDSKPVSDISYSMWPTIALDRTTLRLHWMLNYRSGYTVYQHTGARNNEQDQKVDLDLQYRISPHVTMSLQDRFDKTSNVFNQPDPLSAGEASGTAQPSQIAVTTPVAAQLRNTATGDLTYQFAFNSMIGAGGTVMNLHFSNTAEVPGLSDFGSREGSVFYSQRLSGKEYVGATYRYSEFLAYPVGAQSQTTTHTVFVFYTIYLRPTFSLSLSCGPQQFDVVQSPSPAYQSWSPAAALSLDWRGSHDTRFSASYLRLVTGVAGLVGGFQSNSANASGRWQVASTWNLGAEASYAIIQNVAPASALEYPGGHSVSGTVSLRHPFTDHIRVELGYTRLHQSYGSIPVISIAPDTNAESVSVKYQFARPL
jgi:hypothetical protein